MYDGNVFAARTGFRHEARRLDRWLRGLPEHTGLLCMTTGTARDVVAFCRIAGRRVPDEVAVLGVDPDDLTARLSDPPISTLDQGAARAGFEAARLLDAMMRGEPPPDAPVLVPPLGVTARVSTDVLAVGEPRVAEAIRFVRRHACEGIAVADILRRVPVARRTLEQGFRRHLRCTIHEEITRVRLDRAKHLLSNTDLAVADVAVRCGFAYSTSLSATFAAKVGVTCRQYRRGERPATAGGAG